MICWGSGKPLCIKKKISDRWNWQLSYLVIIPDYLPQLETTAASLINGGERITPHFGKGLKPMKGHKNVFIMRKKKIFRGRHRENALCPGNGSGKRVEEKRAGGRISDRRENSYSSDHCPEVPTLDGFLFSRFVGR